MKARRQWNRDGQTVFVLVVLLLLLLAIGWRAQAAQSQGWTGCTYLMNCCPPPGYGDLCYLEEGRLAQVPICPEGLRSEWLRIDCR